VVALRLAIVLFFMSDPDGLYVIYLSSTTLQEFHFYEFENKIDNIF